MVSGKCSTVPQHSILLGLVYSRYTQKLLTSEPLSLWCQRKHRGTSWNTGHTLCKTCGKHKINVIIKTKLSIRNFSTFNIFPQIKIGLGFQFLIQRTSWHLTVFGINLIQMFLIFLAIIDNNQKRLIVLVEIVSEPLSNVTFLNKYHTCGWLNIRCCTYFDSS